MLQPVRQLCVSGDDENSGFLPLLGGSKTVMMESVWFTCFCLSFRHKLEEAMLTDPWDSMKHADLGGYSAPLGSRQSFYLPQKFTAL